MGCNGTVGLSAGRRVARGDSFWLRPVRPDGHLPRPGDADARPRTGVYVICARNVRRTGRAGRSRAQVDFFADVPAVFFPSPRFFTAEIVF